MILAAILLTTSVRAATESDKIASIQKGLAYLYGIQDPSGTWNSPGQEEAATAAAAYAFLSARQHWGNHADLYQSSIEKAVARLLSTASITEVSERSDGVNVCPGRAGSCKGVYWFGNARSAYTTGLVASALALYASAAGSDAVATQSGPLAGMTWGQIAQGITNALAFSQSTREEGRRRGGWGMLIPGNGDADSFSTHWVSLALLYTQSLGAFTPDVTKQDLKQWVSNVQSASGAACVQPGNDICGQAETGSLLLAIGLSGGSLNDSQEHALTFIRSHWRTSANGSVGIFGQAYPMWSMYTGLLAAIGRDDTQRIDQFVTDCGASTNKLPKELPSKARCNWFEDYAEWLVKNQNADGSWGSSEKPDIVGAALDLAIIVGVQLPVTSEQSAPGALQQQTSRPSPAAVAAVASYRAMASLSGAASVQSDAKEDKVRKRDRKGVTALAVNNAGNALATGSTDNSIRVWNLAGAQTINLTGSTGIPTGLAFTDALLSSVGRDSIVRLWDTAKGSEVASLNGHEHPIRAVAAAPAGNLLATAGEETRIMLWDLRTSKLNKILDGPKDFINALSFSPNGNTLAAAGEEARIFLFDVATGQIVFTLLGHSGPIEVVVFSPNGAILASAGQDTVIRLWDPAKGEQTQALTGHEGPIRALAFSPDSRLLASAGEGTQIRLWNVATGTLARELSGLTSPVNVLVFDPKGLFLASATEAGEIVLWNVTTGIRIISIPVPIAF